jgi:hypothetical protein
VGKGDGRRGGEEESEGDGTCTSTAARRGGDADGGDVGGISGEGLQRELCQQWALRSDQRLNFQEEIIPAKLPSTAAK